MILQALNDYYARRQADPDPARRLPVFGLERRSVDFILDIDRDGRLRRVHDHRAREGQRLLGGAELVPKAVKRTSAVAANLLCDTAEYVLGQPDPGKLEAARAKPAKPARGDDGLAEKNGEAAYRARLVEKRMAFRAAIAALPGSAQHDEGVAAALLFVDANPLAQLKSFAEAAAIADGNPSIALRLHGDDDLIAQRPAVLDSLTAPDVIGSDDVNAPTRGSDKGQETGDRGKATICLVTGESAPAAVLHAFIKGVWNAQTSGANIVSFNQPAFCSHGWEQGENAPVSERAAFAYTTALNALLARGSGQKIQVGDATTVFWCQRADPDAADEAIAVIFGGADAGIDDPDAHVGQVSAAYDALRRGGRDASRGNNRFYVLGLAPNASRLSVRFWHSTTLAEIVRRIDTWFDDIEMVRGPYDRPHPGLPRLLRAVALQGKTENIPPRLGGDVIRAVLDGSPYPAGWLLAAVQRCRAERDVTHLRAAAIRACLNRQGALSIRDAVDPAQSTKPTREISPMLDPNHQSTAYRLGRLFAVLEKIQEEASPGLNATIRERYYGAASSTPVAVFTTLMRLKNHHVAKLPSLARQIFFEKVLAEIVGGIESFPNHLNLPDQGRFAIGYYHQRQDFFAKRTAATAEPAADASETISQPAL